MVALLESAPLTLAVDVSLSSRAMRDADAPPALAVNDNHAALAGVGVSFDAEPRGPPRWRPWRPWRPPLAPEKGPHQPHMGTVLQRLDAGTTLQSAEVRAWGGQAVGT